MQGNDNPLGGEVVDGVKEMVAMRAGVVVGLLLVTGKVGEAGLPNLLTVTNDLAQDLVIARADLNSIYTGWVESNLYPYYLKVFQK